MLRLVPLALSVALAGCNASRSSPRTLLGKSGPAPAPSPAPAPAPSPGPPAANAGVLAPFASEGDFQAYMAYLSDKQSPAPTVVDGTLRSADGQTLILTSSGGTSNGSTPATSSSNDQSAPAASPSFAPAARPVPDHHPAPGSNAVVTNDQTAGVDEGGLVKVIGNSLVVLQGGWLYAVDLSGAAPAQTDQLQVAADAALAADVTYPELLVSGTRAYVLGYRRNLKADGVDGEVVLAPRGAVEINAFELSGGHFARKGSQVFEAEDFTKTGAAYASRLTGSTLLVDAPFAAFQPGTDGKPRVTLPRRLAYQGGGKFALGAPLLAPTDVFHPLADPKSATFHGLIRCDLTDPAAISCTGKAVLGEATAQHYVSDAAVYLWSGAYVYSVQLADSAMAAHKVAGTVPGPLAFAEASGRLLVVADEADAAAAAPALLSLDLAAFDSHGAQTLDDTNRHALGAAKGFTQTACRFVGSAAVVGFAQGSESKLLVVDLATGGVTDTGLKTAATQIEGLDGSRAVVFGAGQTGGRIDVVSLAGGALGSATLPAAAAGGSHGFFYRPAGDGSGVFGVSVAASVAAASGAQLVYESVDAGGGLAAVGAVTGSADAAVAVPVFLNDQILSLVGTQLSVGTVTGGALQTTATVTLAHP